MPGVADPEIDPPARASSAFGEKGVVEFTSLVAFWALFLTATAPNLTLET